MAHVQSTALTNLRKNTGVDINIPAHKMWLLCSRDCSLYCIR